MEVNDTNKKSNKIKLAILFSTVIILLGLLACLITGAIFLKQALATDIFKYKFIYASMVGVSAFLIVLISLNFTTFLSSNKDWIKHMWGKHHDQ